MKLLEYEAKSLLKQCDLPVPRSVRITEGENMPSCTFPGVLKSQVPIGGRGKAGGVRVIADESALRTAIGEVMNLPIGGFLPTTLLFEERIDVQRELYLSLTLDRQTSSIELIAHPAGGVEIESQDSEGFLKLQVGDWKTENRKTDAIQSWEAVGEQLAELYDTPEQTFALQDMIKRLYACFVQNDATLLEINPLVLTTAGDLMAGDCKMVLDDAAAFRHPEWEFETTPTDANFVVLDERGTVATIANGAGLAMATVDSVARAGLVPANFLDIGGGASSQSLARQFTQIAQLPRVSAIIINIFGGIVQCDTVARSIIEARQSFKDLAPLYIRLTGNNADKASVLLEEHGLTNYQDLEEIIQEVSS